MTEFKEKRRYFRIEDRMELACKIIQGDEPVQNSVRREQVRSEAFVELESKIQFAYEKVKGKQPEVAELFGFLNRKVNMLIKADTDSFLSEEERLYEQPVNLSACGIAFFIEEQVSLGKRLLLTMRLKPAHTEISVVAVVINCSESSEYNIGDSEQQEENTCPAYLVRADFTDLSDQQQELLIQHVMQGQARHLKNRRQAEN